MSQPITMYVATREQNYLALVAGSDRSTAGCSGDILQAIRQACKLPSDAFFVNEHHELDAIRSATRAKRVVIRVRRKREIHVIGEAP